ncbi:MAG: YHS domain-containing protein [Acidobacteria bacterium]|nr:YHS domain-containing protein [Acidobacteriota bacterium]
MLRFVLAVILFVLVGRALVRLVGIVIDAAGGREARADSGGPTSTKLVRDPVCGTYVPPRLSLSITAAGSTHYFCSEQCRTTFGDRA